MPLLPFLQRLAASWACVCSLTLVASASEPVSFRSDIAPLLLEHCASCHGPKKAEGGYRLDSFAQLSQAGDSGIAPLAPADEHASELIRRLTTDDVAERMPAEREALPKETLDLFKRWQSEGGRFDGQDPTASIFDLVPDRTYPSPPQHYAVPVPITAVAFSPDGSQVIASGYHELTVWDRESGQLMRRIANLPERIYALDWSPDRKLLAAAGGAPGRIGEVRLIDWESGQVIKCVGRAADVIQIVRFQPGGQLLATGNADGTVRWFDTKDWLPVRSLASHADAVSDIRWNQDGSRLASASRDKTAKVFNVESGELLATYSGHAEPVSGICFNDGDKEMTSIGGDKKAHRWQIEGGKALAKVDLSAAATRMHVNGSNVWLAMTDRTLRQLELATTKLTSKLEGHTAWVTAVCAHADANRLVSGGLNGEIRLWKLDDGAPVKTWIAVPGTSEQNKL